MFLSDVVTTVNNIMRKLHQSFQYILSTEIQFDIFENKTDLRYVPSTNLLAIQELDEKDIGNISFHSKDSVIKVCIISFYLPVDSSCLG